MIISAYNIYCGKDKIIENTVESQKTDILNEVYKLENSFYLSFYELAAEFTVIDAYDFFLEADCQSNIFSRNIDIMDKERGARFFKIMAMHHTIKILRQKRMDLNPDDMAKCMFDVYGFDEDEQKLFNLLFICAVKFKEHFPSLFSKSLSQYLFGEEAKSPFALAFIENFCYNSYKTFMGYLSKYISINRRIKLAKQA